MRSLPSRSLRWSPLLLLVLAGCSTTVATDLDEADANVVVVALAQRGITADKGSDEAHEGRFAVTVSREDGAAAVATLARENLPARRSPGVLESLGPTALVPSRLAEHAKLVQGTAGELERSLRAVDGILSARVHLALEQRDPLASFAVAAGAARPDVRTASVLLRHRGATPPLAKADVQRLVAGAVPGLDADKVSVVLTATPTPAADATEPALVRFGPVEVSRGSVPTLRWCVGAVAVANLLLATLLLVLWWRGRRARDELNELRAELAAAEQQPG